MMQTPSRKSSRISPHTCVSPRSSLSLYLELESSVKMTKFSTNFNIKLLTEGGVVMTTALFCFAERSLACSERLPTVARSHWKVYTRFWIAEEKVVRRTLKLIGSSAGGTHCMTRESPCASIKQMSGDTTDRGIDTFEHEVHLPRAELKGPQELECRETRVDSDRLFAQECCSLVTEPRNVRVVSLLLRALEHLVFRISTGSHDQRAQRIQLQLQLDAGLRGEVARFQCCTHLDNLIDCAAARFRCRIRLHDFICAEQRHCKHNQQLVPSLIRDKRVQLVQIAPCTR
eukprot:1654928-Prymnesium_polylepis.1